MENTLNFKLVNLADDGELRASTEAIALGYGMQHRAVLQLLKRYLPQIETFGPCAFSVRVAERAQGGGAPIEYALLNQHQTMFLLSLMRNTAKVVAFKIQLIQAFSQMADRLHNRDLTMWERRLRFETKDATSKAKGTVGSLLMTKRKVEKKPLDAERFLLEQEMQPGLFLN